MSTRNLRFFLGGRDLEMREIAALIAGTLGPDAVEDDHLAWGARLSHYAPRIAAAHAAGDTPVAVELSDDMPRNWPAREKLVLIDHHGARAGGPSSLAQVFTLLGLASAAWTRRLRLVEANDIDHLRGLFAAGASQAEAAAIRAEDRAAQGVTPEEEAAGGAAAAAAEVLAGGLRVIELPHRRTAAAMDPLALALWPSLPEALVLARGETGFFGRGAAIAALDRAFPGGWSGGALPDHGFWGHAGSGGAPPGREQALAVLFPLFSPGAEAGRGAGGTGEEFP